MHVSGLGVPGGNVCMRFEGVKVTKLRALRGIFCPYVLFAFFSDLVTAAAATCRSRYHYQFGESQKTWEITPVV